MYVPFFIRRTIMEGEFLIGGLDADTRTMLLAGICIYTCLILGIGWFSSRRIHNVEDYLVAGRRLPLWMATGTLLATWFGAGSSMGVAAQVYDKNGGGLFGVVADPFGASLSLILAGIFIVGLLRRNMCYTVTDIIEKRFGKSAGIYASFWMLPVYIGWLGAQIIGLGTILFVVTGIDVWYGMIIGTAVVLIYTYAGGMWAVTLTDIVQVTVIIIGLCLLLPEVMDMAGGWNGIFAEVPESDLTLFPPADNIETFTYNLGQWIIMGLGCMVGQDLVQRSLASKNEKVAVTSSILSGFIYLALALVPITIGFAARVILKDIPPEAMGSNLENQILPRMAILGLGNIHPVLLTIFLAALVSAIMSSADSSLLAASSLFSNNIIKPLCKNISEKCLLVIARVSSVVIILAAAWLALSVESIYSLMTHSWASQLVIVFTPVIGALYFKKADSMCCWGGMITATAVWIGYTAITTAKEKLGFLRSLTESVSLERNITVGAVYGFAAGTAVFLILWFYSAFLRKSSATTQVKENV